MSQLTLESVADLDGLVFRVDADRKSIGPELFAGADVKGKAVLVHTGWDKHWRTDQYFEGNPFLTATAAEWLRNSAAALVGIDSLNIDDTAGDARPVHSILLGADIPIVEHMCRLEEVPETAFKFNAVPARAIPSSMARWVALRFRTLYETMEVSSATIVCQIEPTCCVVGGASSSQRRAHNHV